MNSPSYENVHLGVRARPVFLVGANPEDGTSCVNEDIGEGLVVAGTNYKGE